MFYNVSSRCSLLWQPVPMCKRRMSVPARGVTTYSLGPLDKASVPGSHVTIARIAKLQSPPTWPQPWTSGSHKSSYWLQLYYANAARGHFIGNTGNLAIIVLSSSVYTFESILAISKPYWGFLSIRSEDLVSSVDEVSSTAVLIKAMVLETPSGAST